MEKEKEDIKLDEAEAIVQIVGEEELTEADMMFSACPPSARCSGSEFN